MEFVINGDTYRVKKLNAIRVLAIRTQADFSDVDKAEQFFGTLLECLEVNVNGLWEDVKLKGKNIFCPRELEDNPLLVKELCETFTEKYLYPLFQGSSESKEELGFRSLETT